MKVVVTGATGYIGSRLTMELISRNIRVVGAARSAPLTPCEWLPFDLSSGDSVSLPIDTDMVIHLASSISGDVPPQAEQRAARHLIDQCDQLGARFLFVSSQTAKPEASTNYGLVKWAIEQDTAAHGGVILRLGQVYGGPATGLFGQLVSLVRNSPILPHFFPHVVVQPVHIDDVVGALLAIVLQPQLRSGIINLASPVPIDFTSFLSAIAEHRLDKHRYFIPVPKILIEGLGKLTGEKSTVGKAIGRLSSLFNLPMLENTTDLQKLGISLRPFPFGMAEHPTTERHELLREGSAILSYVLKEKPSGALLRKYMQAAETLDGGAPVGLPGLALRRPATLALFDGTSSATSQLTKRLDMAIAIAEASPQGAKRFLGLLETRGFWSALREIFVACLKEMAWRVAALPAALLLRLPSRKSDQA